MIALQDKLLGERIFLVHSKNYTGCRAYFFLNVHPRKLPLFQDALENTARHSIDLADYGEILASGYGNAPQEIRDAITKKYGWKAN